MNKKNAAYWQKRAELLEQAQHNKTIEYFGTLEREYQKAIAATEKEINNWYARFANENKVSFQEAQKLLSKKELDEFRWTVEDYIKYGKENAQNQAWVKQLENASARAHISRLDALKVQMQNQVEMLMGNERDGVTDLIEDIYTSSYYQSIFDIQKGSGIAFNFSKLDTSAVEKVISKPWTTDGTNFSERIWGNYRPALVNDLHTALTQATIKGDNPKTLVNKISKRYKVKQSQAENLCLTEGAFFRSSGQYSGYKESGVNEYEICATLDGKTSEICREMDSKHFSIAKWQVGVTAPPFHNRCRTATCPYFDDEFTVDETRIARDENGNSYTVEDMSYSEWKEKFVDNIDKKSFTNKTKSDIIKTAYKEPKVGYKDYAEAERVLAPDVNSWMPTLTEDNKDTIQEYTTASYESINQWLRTGEGYNEAHIKEVVTGIDDGIAKFTLTNDISVIRGTTTLELDGLGLDLNNIVGGAYRNSAYTSTSLAQNVAEEFAENAVQDIGDEELLIQFDIPAGQGRGAYISGLSAAGPEMEFLIKRDAQFEIYEKTELSGNLLLKARWKE